MSARLSFKILPQPDDFTCGPTCLHAVYNYYGEDITLTDVISQTQRLENGGTLGVLLAGQALKRGYKATIYTYNLEMFDPTWFASSRINLSDKLRKQAEVKRGARFQTATKAYLQFLESGGKVRFEDISASLIRRFLKEGIPILTGLSATYLYRTAREYGVDDDYDDIRGHPSGHFVVLCGYDRERKMVTVADPMQPNPVAESALYEVSFDRLIGAILLGTLTYDDNLLIIEQPGRSSDS